jgi:hypothetical protein
VTELGTWGVFALFGALVLAVGGISIFSLGAMFNYLVALFHHHPVRQGLFGRPIFDPPLEYHFGWLGVLASTGGVVASLVSVGLSASGWDITRLWFWLVTSAMILLVGLQLIFSWVVMRVLERLSERDRRISQQLGQPQGSIE